MKTIQCLRCNAHMRHVMDTKFSAWPVGLALGRLAEFARRCAGGCGLCVPNCGKIELFQSEQDGAENHIAQHQCRTAGCSTI